LANAEDEARPSGPSPRPRSEPGTLLPTVKAAGAEPRCCGGPPPRDQLPEPPRASWIDGAVKTVVGDVPRVRTALSRRDRLGAVRARWGVGRMRYRVRPGLYAVGAPRADSPVLVSANYKLSFDHLRRALGGRDAWILVLDTRGINVWCAAGKGTFGTDEIVRRVQGASLGNVVSHRTLIVPQLGAPGVSAHEVRRRCGFRVVYGPVRAADLPAFLDDGLKASPQMRRVRFDLRDRVILVPVEVVTGGKFALLVAAGFLLLGGLGPHGYSLGAVRLVGLSAAALALGAFLGGAILGPTLLPWLPGRALSLKGAVLGLILAAAVAAIGWLGPGLGLGLGLGPEPGPGPAGSWLHLAAWGLMIPAVTSFVVMNFTGATTYTSLSGVLREMRIAVPAQIVVGALGLALWVTGLFLNKGGAA